MSSKTENENSDTDWELFFLVTLVLCIVLPAIGLTAVTIIQPEWWCQ